MLEYIYFVKCPGCEDEHFNFFNEAKEYAMSLLSKKPIITQIEVDRNDFGECVDSCDLGTVWSWEEMMQDTSTESETVFTKADTLCDCGGKCGDNCKCGKRHEDPEFDALDNSLEVDIRKPVPADMSISDLVEAMEANEDTVECAGCEELFAKDDCFYKEGIGWLCSDCEDRIVKCTWCEELYDRSECRKEVDMGWLCDRCQAGIMSRGEPLTFRENDYWDFLDENLQDSMTLADLVKDSINHLVNDLGKDSTAEDFADDVIGDLERNYHDVAPEDFAKYQEWCSEVACEVSRQLNKQEGLTEAFDRNANVEFNYDSLKVTLQGPKRDVDDWDEADETVSYIFTKKKDDVATDIWENFIEEVDAKDVEGGLDTLEDDKAWYTFLETHFDTLLDKYYDKLLKYYEDDARKEYEETHSLDESMDPHDLVELEYPSLTVTLYSEKRAEDDWDEFEHTDSHVFLVPKVEVATAIWENWITEEDVKDVEGGLEALDNDIAWEKFLETHFDNLFEKYNKQILEFFREEATEDFRERSQEEYQMDSLAAAQDSAYDAWRDERYFGESKQKSFLEEFDDAEAHKANLTDCPECGAAMYDMKEQYCSNCGLGL